MNIITIIDWTDGPIRGKFCLNWWLNDNLQSHRCHFMLMSIMYDGWALNYIDNSITRALASPSYCYNFDSALAGAELH